MKIKTTIVALLAVIISHSSNASNTLQVQQLPICYDFGCKIKSYVELNSNDWQSIVNIFATPSNNAHIERIKIAKAVAQMEQLAAQYTPIANDIGYNVGKGSNLPGQLDCIDESINTTTYLTLFNRAGFLKHHDVVERAYRQALFDQHWSGQIREKNTQNRYVVDAWFKKNGELPLIQPIDEWLDIPLHTSY